MSRFSPSALALRQSMADNFADHPGASYHVLVGAGFSRSAGIPTAREVASILARRKVGCDGSSPQRIPWTNLIEEYFRDPGPYEAALAQLQGGSTDPLSYGEIYQKLFSELFGNPLARSDFIRNLILSARDRYDGYNFEGLYLAYLCNRFPQIHTVLTTNFDDVIAASFSFLGTPCRIIDRPELILQEDVSTQLPRILYLHGRYLNYHVINTDKEIEASRKACSTDLNGSHGEAIQSIVKELSGGGLIVLGYAGWEDAVMDALRTQLQRGRFRAGIYWCHYRGPVSANVLDLSQYDGFHVLEGLSAIEATRALLEAAGLGEIEVIEKVRAVNEAWRTNFERRLISVEVAQHGIKHDLGREIAIHSDELAVPSVAEALEEARRAEADSRLNVVALQIVEASLRKADELANQDRSDLYLARATLRHRNAINLEQTITDFFWALRLAETPSLRALIGLADCLFRGGFYEGAMDILAQAESLAGTLAEPKWLACCQVIRGLIDYNVHDDVDHARELLTTASETLLQEGDETWWTRTQFNLGFMEEFEGNYSAAEDSCERVLSRESSAFKSPRLASAFLLLRSKLRLRKADVAGARRDLLNGERCAYKGPYFDLLGWIALHLAECSFRSGKAEQAVLESQEAIRFLGLAGKRKEQAQAKALLDIYRISTEPSPTEAMVQDIIASYEKLVEARVVASTSWAILSWYCHASPNPEILRELSRHAARKSREILEAPPDSPGEVETRSRPSWQKVLSFALQYTALAELLVGLRELADPSDPDRLRALYDELKRGVKSVGFQSSHVEVVHAAVALRLIEAGVLAFADLVDLPGRVKPDAFDRRWVRDLARSSKHPRLGRIL